MTAEQTDPPRHSGDSLARLGAWSTVVAAVAAVFAFGASLANALFTRQYVELTRTLLERAAEPMLTVEGARLEDDNAATKSMRIGLHIINRGNGPARADIKLEWRVGEKSVAPRGTIPQHQLVPPQSQFVELITIEPDSYDGVAAGVPVDIVLDASYTGIPGSPATRYHWRGVYDRRRGADVSVLEDQ